MIRSLMRNTCIGSCLLFIVLGGVFAIPSHAAAQTPERDFSLQVTPSPIIESIAPGQTKEIELKIHNAGSTRETLVIAPRSFRYNNTTEQVELLEAKPEIAPWLSFSAEEFTVAPGAWFTERVTVAVPKNAGFSYSFTLLIKRRDDTAKPVPGTRNLQGAVAIFTLLNIDRPGATRKIDVATFSATKRMYEYLPSEFKVKLRNSGNTIVQPYGNIFIQRRSTDPEPIGKLDANGTNGYILPGTTRTFTATWDDGFPAYQTVKDADNTTPKKRLVWDWSKVTSLRVGKYTAKLVAVYNDGRRDIPIQTEVSFWVIPWRILIGLGVFGLILAFGIWSMVRSFIRTIRKNKKHAHFKM